MEKSRSKRIRAQPKSLARAGIRALVPSLAANLPFPSSLPNLNLDVKSTSLSQITTAGVCETAGGRVAELMTSGARIFRRERLRVFV